MFNIDAFLYYHWFNERNQLHIHRYCNQSRRSRPCLCELACSAAVWSTISAFKYFADGVRIC